MKGFCGVSFLLYVQTSRGGEGDEQLGSITFCNQKGGFASLASYICKATYDILSSLPAVQLAF